MVSFFITVVARNIAYVFHLLFFVIDFYCVDFGSQVEILLIFLLLFFLVFSGLIRRLEILGRRGRRSFRSRSLGSVTVMVFH